MADLIRQGMFIIGYPQEKITNFLLIPNQFSPYIQYFV